MKLLHIAAMMTMLGLSLAQAPSLKIETVMTAAEIQRTGVASLSKEQRAQLDLWLVGYTVRILKLAQQSNTRSLGSVDSGCRPAIESTISGQFNGWDGETIFKLDNGQIWQQAEYDYMYSYAYRPEVIIYPTSDGCKLKVEDEEETIVVRRLK